MDKLDLLLNGAIESSSFNYFLVLCVFCFLFILSQFLIVKFLKGKDSINNFSSYLVLTFFVAMLDFVLTIMIVAAGLKLFLLISLVFLLLFLISLFVWNKFIKGDD